MLAWWLGFLDLMVWPDFAQFGEKPDGVSVVIESCASASAVEAVVSSEMAEVMLDCVRH